MHVKFTLGCAKIVTALATTESSATGLLTTLSVNYTAMSTKVFNRPGVAAAVLRKVSSLTDLITK